MTGMGSRAAIASWVAAAVLATAVLAGCGPPEPSTQSFPSGSCQVHYRKVTTAATLAKLKRKLLRMPRIATIRTVPSTPGDHKISVALLGREVIVIMALELWRREDGTWTAQNPTDGCI